RDWSSDVCSSDLIDGLVEAARQGQLALVLGAHDEGGVERPAQKLHVLGVVAVQRHHADHGALLTRRSSATLTSPWPSEDVHASWGRASLHPRAWASADGRASSARASPRPRRPWPWQDVPACAWGEGPPREPARCPWAGSPHRPRARRQRPWPCSWGRPSPSVQPWPWGPPSPSGQP